MGEAVSHLSYGVNLKGLVGSLRMRPGEASIAQDVYYRDDGPYYGQYGWLRKNVTALGGTVYAHKGFSFKGKNSPDVRPGNFGVPNDGPNFTKRVDFYSGAIALTDTQLLRWDQATLTYQNVALPGGTTVAPDPKPTILVTSDQCYIVGWADRNLKYDPVDEVCYEWGWDVVPAATGAVGGAGTLIRGTYRYWVSWINLFTGEESALDPVDFAGSDTVTVNGAQAVDITLQAYNAGAGGVRHYGPGVGAANEDVGCVIYRSDYDQAVPYFLDLVQPDVTGAYTDDGTLDVDRQTIGNPQAFVDPPRLNQFVDFATQWYGISWDENFARVYWNDFTGINSFWERTDVRNYKEIPLEQGEVLIAVCALERNMIALSNLNGYMVYSDDGKVTKVDTLKWSVGCVGPRAWLYNDAWLHFLAEKGPYRWQPGLVEPDWIGKPLSPLFIDPISGLCQMSETSRALSEVAYNQDTRRVHYIFPCGSTTLLNRHASWWVDAPKYNKDPASGWSLHSWTPQCLDYTHAINGLVGGLPYTPFENRGRFIFADELNYVNSLEPDTYRGGLPIGPPARGDILAGSGVNLVVTNGGLFTSGDGMTGMRLEVHFADGTVEVTTVASNTGTNIVPTDPFSQDPTGGIWYVAGIPMIWRSWVDHMGDPTAHKDVTQLYIGYLRMTGSLEPVIDVTVAHSGDWPAGPTRTRTARLSQHRDKLLIARTGRYFTYEFANTYPDETFLMSFLQTEDSILRGRRKR